MALVLAGALLAPVGSVVGQPSSPNTEGVDPEDNANQPVPPTHDTNTDPGHNMPGDLETPTTNPNVDGDHDEAVAPPSQTVVYVVLVDGSASMGIPVEFAGGNEAVADDDTGAEADAAASAGVTRLDVAVGAARKLLTRLVAVANALQRHKASSRNDAGANENGANNTTRRADDNEPHVGPNSANNAANNAADPNNNGGAGNDAGNDAGNGEPGGSGNDHDVDGDGQANSADGAASDLFSRYQAGDRFLLGVLTDRVAFWRSEPQPLTQALVNRGLDSLSRVKPRGRADLSAALRAIAAKPFDLEVFVIGDDIPRPAQPSRANPRDRDDADRTDDIDRAAHIVRAVAEIRAISPMRRNWVRIQFVVDVDDAARQFARSLATGQLLSMVSNEQFPVRFHDP